MTLLDPLPHLEAVARAMRDAGQPEAGFRALDLAMGAVIGHKLFTVLLHHAEARESERRYTNQPAAYPVGGRKPVTASAWTNRLFIERRPYVGRSAEDIRTVFFDHELILSLGCASVLNVPVAETFAALAAPALLELTRG